MSDRRPFDTLDNAIDKTVIIRLKDGPEIKGVLRSFDVHMNVVMEDAEELTGGKKKFNTVIVRGDNILLISPERGE